MLFALGPPSPSYTYTGEVRELESKQTASNEAMSSLQNENALLKGTFLTTVLHPISLSIHTGKLTETQSAQLHQRVRARIQKKRRIRHPKGSGWPLQNAMGLANDETKYKRVVVRALLFTTNSPS